MKYALWLSLIGLSANADAFTNLSSGAAMTAFRKIDLNFAAAADTRRTGLALTNFVASTNGGVSPGVALSINGDSRIYGQMQFQTNTSISFEEGSGIEFNQNTFVTDQSREEFWNFNVNTDLGKDAQTVLRVGDLKATQFTFANGASDFVQINNLTGELITSGTVAEARLASTLARDSEVLDATNTLNTSLRAALAQTNIFNGRSFTNMGTIGRPGVNSSFVTNGALIWFVTNNTPAEVLPNGSIASVTDGRFFVRTNNTWLRK